MDTKISGISVILCCYNSAARIENTLRYLAAQKQPHHLDWEIILVDNNSTDGTVKIAEDLWGNFKVNAKLRVIHEPTPGLSFARHRGMRIASYNVYLFCDDDNWLSANYLDTVFLTFTEFPETGALGGWCEPVFEGDKPEWFDTFAGNFAVGKPKEQTGLLDKANQFIYGAGMALRQEVVQQLKQRGFKNMLSDRKGNLLSSGGDVELIYGIKLLNIPIMFNDLLFFHHYMPKSRMTWEYLIRLRNSMHWSNFVLDMYLDCLKKRSIGFGFILEKIKKSIIFVYIKSGQLENLDKYDSLFLKNQIEIRKLFLINPFFYYTAVKALKKIQYG